MRRTTWFLAAILILAAACGDSADGASPVAGATGTLRLGIEEIDGVFIEGFELTLEVVDAAGETTTSRWADLVQGDLLEWPDGIGRDDIERWYTGVLVRELPAGETTVTSKLDVGMEPPGEPCRVSFDVPAEGVVEVRIGLTAGPQGCPVVATGGP